MKFLKYIIFYAFLLGICPPFVIGVIDSFVLPRPIEQLWLTSAIIHLRAKRLICTDPEIREVLTYTIKRYNKIGPWDVNMIRFHVPCERAIGMNLCYCPGLSLDPYIMKLPIEIGASILVHEAAHDYWPFLHPFIDPLTDKIDSDRNYPNY